MNQHSIRGDRRRLSRRLLLRSALGASVVGLLAACGGDDDDEGEAGDPTSTPVSEPTATDVEPTAAPEATATGEDAPATSADTGTSADAGTFPTTVEHKYGSTTIESDPKRVVSLGYKDQDSILAVGVKPIAVRYWYGDEPYAVYPWAQEALADATPEVLDMPELDFEKVVALEPDLIIGVYLASSAEEYETLSRIAPTVAQSGDYIDYGMPWQESTVVIGRALGREDLAQELVEAVETQYDEARQAHPNWAGKRVVVGSPGTDGQFGFFASQDQRSRIFTSLGFEVPAEFDEIAGDQFYGTISIEQAEILDQDLLVFQQLEFVEGGRAAIEADPLLSQLKVMQEGRAIYIDGELDDALQFCTVLSLPFLLEGVIPMIEAALGDE